MTGKEAVKLACELHGKPCEDGIMFESNGISVRHRPKRKAYEVYRDGVTAATQVAAFPLSADGLSLALCHAAYLASHPLKVA